MCVQPVKMTYNMIHKALYEEIMHKTHSFGISLLPCTWAITVQLATAFLIADLFIELSGHSTQFTTNEYIPEDSLTKYHAT